MPPAVSRCCSSRPLSCRARQVSAVQIYQTTYYVSPDANPGGSILHLKPRPLIQLRDAR